MKKFLTLSALIFLPLLLFGQLTPVTNQYILNPMTINPAYAGNRGGLSLAAFYRQQWVGLAGAPRTMSLQVDARCSHPNSDWASSWLTIR